MEKSKKEEVLNLMGEIETQLAELGAVVRNETDDTKGGAWLLSLYESLQTTRDSLSDFQHYGDGAGKY